MDLSGGSAYGCHPCRPGVPGSLSLRRRHFAHTDGGTHSGGPLCPSSLNTPRWALTKWRSRAAGSCKVSAISVARVALGTLLHLVVSSAAGYALSKRHLPGSRFFMLLVLIAFLFGPGLIPYYLVVRSLGLVNTFWMMVVPGAAGGVGGLYLSPVLYGVAGRPGGGRARGWGQRR